MRESGREGEEGRCDAQCTECASVRALAVERNTFEKRGAPRLLHTYDRLNLLRIIFLFLRIDAETDSEHSAFSSIFKWEGVNRESECESRSKQASILKISATIKFCF